jgi:hypothetical protein
MSAVEQRHRLPFDPVEEAAKQWATQWGRGASDACGDLAHAGASAAHYRA